MTDQRFQLKSAVHLFLLRGNELLMLRRFQTGYEDGNYSVVAGHLDGGEEVKTATVREAREEAGIELDPADLEVVGVMHRKANDERIDFFVAARNWKGEIRNCEPQKCDDLSWFPLDNLPENTIPYVRQAVENFQRGNWFDSYGWQPEDQMEQKRN